MKNGFSLKNLSLITLVGIFSSTPLLGQLSLGTTSYSQNFNSYAGTALTVPSGWSVSFSGTPTYSGIGTGTSTSGGAWAYGSSGDYSFGALRSGTPGSITIDSSFTNNTGGTITSLTLTWNYEQYRFANASGFSIAGTGSLSGVSAISSYSFAGSASGTNGTVAQTLKSMTLTGLNITVGSTFGFRWVTTDVSGADNGIAIDDVNLALTAVPEPSTYAAIAGVFALGGVMWHRRRQRSAAAKA